MMMMIIIIIIIIIVILTLNRTSLSMIIKEGTGVLIDVAIPGDRNVM